MVIKLSNGDWGADFGLVPYTPPGVTPLTQQVVSVWLPDPVVTPQPEGGWPWLAQTFFGGYTTVQAASQFTPGLFPSYVDKLARGIALVHFGLTGANAFGGGLETVNGKGLWHPPSAAEWDEDDRPFALKEAVWMVQFVRSMAGEWGLSREKIGLEGQSAGATTCALVAALPDQADATASDFRSESSRVRAVMGHIAQPDFNIYSTATTPPNTLNPFPKAGDFNQRAANYADVPAGYLDELSFLRVLGSDADARTRNGTGTAFFYSVYSYVLSGTGFDFVGTDGPSTGKTWDASNLDPNDGGDAHVPEGGYVTLKRLREIESGGWHTDNSKLVVEPDQYEEVAGGADSAENDLVHAILPYSVVPSQQRYDTENDWWQAQLGAAPVAGKRLVAVPDLSKVVDARLVATAAGADLAVLQGDLEREDGLRTAVLLSLFSDRRARPADELPDDRGVPDLRGWWAEDPADPFGSLLWLDERSTITAATLRRVERAASEALQWMIREGLADSIEASARRGGPEGRRAIIELRVSRQPGGQWDAAWEALRRTPLAPQSGALEILVL